MNINTFFHSTYTIGIERYQQDNDFIKVIPAREDNQLEDISRNLIQYIEGYTTRSKYCTDENCEGCEINIGSFEVSKTK